MPSITVDAARLAAHINAVLERGERTLINLEAESGVSTRTIYAIRTGSRLAVELDTADRLCSALGIALSEVIIEPDPTDELREGWCPTCRDTVATFEERACPWCGGRITGGRKPGKRLDTDLTCITSDVLREAYALYAGGLSLRRVAGRILARTTYSSVENCSTNIYAAWQLRGWKLRDHATAVANRVVDPCSGTNRRGEPCRNGRMTHSEFCAIHDPTRAARVRDATARMRDRAVSQQEPVDELRAEVEPWLRAYGRGGITRLAELTGINSVTVRGIVHPDSPNQYVRRESADAIRAAIAAHAPRQLVDAGVIADALAPWIAQYGRGAIVELARHTDLSPTAVRHRLNRRDTTMPRELAQQLLQVLEPRTQQDVLERAAVELHERRKDHR